MKLDDRKLYNQDLDGRLAVLFGIQDRVHPALQEIVPLPRHSGKKCLIAIDRIVSGVLAAGILGCLGAFFLFVPALPVITVAAILGGLLTMLRIGFHLGSASQR